LAVWAMAWVRPMASRIQPRRLPRRCWTMRAPSSAAGIANSGPRAMKLVTNRGGGTRPATASPIVASPSDHTSPHITHAATAQARGTGASSPTRADGPRPRVLAPSSRSSMRASVGPQRPEIVTGLGTGLNDAPTAARPPGACQRGKWSSWTGFTLRFSWEPSPSGASIVVLAGRATGVP
jgi:hypothetical protein